MDIRDIARLSGYSVGTVSRVLNDHPGVSERARTRVLEVVREVGYEPNTNARHLKMRGRASFAIMVKGMQNMLFNDLIEKAEGLFAAADEEARVHFVDEDADEVARAAHLDRIRHPKGFLFLGGDPNNFRAGFDQIGVPCVLLTNTAEAWGLRGLSSFSTNDAEAAGAVIDYLWECGHRRIGVLGGNRALSEVSTHRLAGVTRAFERHGAAFDAERCYEPCRFSMGEGYQAGHAPSGARRRPHGDLRLRRRDRPRRAARDFRPRVPRAGRHLARGLRRRGRLAVLASRGSRRSARTPGFSPARGWGRCSRRRATASAPTCTRSSPSGSCAARASCPSRPPRRGASVRG